MDYQRQWIHNQGSPQSLPSQVRRPYGSPSEINYDLVSWFSPEASGGLMENPEDTKTGHQSLFANRWDGKTSLRPCQVSEKLLDSLAAASPDMAGLSTSN
jgi:hypothetical protein